MNNMFTFLSWLDELFKGHGHRYIKRIPYMTPKGRRYRYIYKVHHRHKGKHILDPKDMKEGAKFMVHSESGKEVHAHITARVGNTVTFVYDDGDKKGQTETVHVDRLAKLIDEAVEVGTKLREQRAKLTEDIEQAKKTGSEKQIQRLIDRRSNVDKTIDESHLFLDHPAYKRGGSPFMALIEQIQDGLDTFLEGDRSELLALLVNNGLIEEVASDENETKYAVTDEGLAKYNAYIEEKIEEQAEPQAPATEEELEKEPDLIPDPEDHFEPEKDTRFKPRRRLPDLGEIIAGARKHMQSRELTEAEMRKNFTREKLTGWKGLIKEADTLQESGNTPSASILKQAIIESISATPFKLGKNDPKTKLVWTETGDVATEDAGTVYKDGVEFVMKSLDACKTEQDVLTFLYEWSQLASLRPMKRPKMHPRSYKTLEEAVKNKEQYDGTIEHTTGKYGDLVKKRLVSENGETIEEYVTKSEYKFVFSRVREDGSVERLFDGGASSEKSAILRLQGDSSLRVTVERSDRIDTDGGYMTDFTTVGKHLDASALEGLKNIAEGETKYQNARYLDVPNAKRRQMNVMTQVLSGVPTSPSEKEIEKYAHLASKLSPQQFEKLVTRDFEQRRRKYIKSNPMFNLIIYGVEKYSADVDTKLDFPSFYKPKKLHDMFKRAEQFSGKEWDDPAVASFFEKSAVKKKAGWRFKREASGTAVRVGGVELPKNITQEDLLSQMNLRGLQWGKAMTRTDQDTHVTNAFGAFSDLASILGMEAREMGLKGELAMAYGARGKGRAKAHYERNERVINLTRRTGAGSLAHEWGHALDHLLHSHYGIEKPTYTIFDSEGNGNSDNLLSTQIFHAEHNPSIHNKLPPKIKKAYEDVVNAMLYTPVSAPTEQDIKQVSKQINELERTRLELKAKARKARQSADLLFEGRDESSYVDEHNELVPQENRLREQRTFLRTIADPNPAHYPASSKDVYEKRLQEKKLAREKAPSRYKADADVIGTTGYWGTVKEMFARAFESYIQDELTTKGQKNTYLVNGTQKIQETGKQSRLTPNGEHAQVYPQGAERARINQAMKQLVNVLRDEGVLSKSLVHLDTESFTFTSVVDQLLKGLR